MTDAAVPFSVSQEIQEMSIAVQREQDDRTEPHTVRDLDSKTKQMEVSGARMEALKQARGGGEVAELQSCSRS